MLSFVRYCYIMSHIAQLLYIWVRGSLVSAIFTVIACSLRSSIFCLSLCMSVFLDLDSNGHFSFSFVCFSIRPGATVHGHASDQLDSPSSRSSFVAPLCHLAVVFILLNVGPADTAPVFTLIPCSMFASIDMCVAVLFPILALNPICIICIYFVALLALLCCTCAL